MPDESFLNAKLLQNSEKGLSIRCYVTASKQNMYSGTTTANGPELHKVKFAS